MPRSPVLGVELSGHKLPTNLGPVPNYGAPVRYNAGPDCLALSPSLRLPASCPQGARRGTSRIGNYDLHMAIVICINNLTTCTFQYSRTQNFRTFVSAIPLRILSCLSSHHVRPPRSFINGFPPGPNLKRPTVPQWLRSRQHRDAPIPLTILLVLVCVQPDTLPHLRT